MTKNKKLKTFKVNLTLTQDSEPLEIDAISPREAYQMAWDKAKEDPDYWLGWELGGEVDPIEENQDDKKEI